MVVFSIFMTAYLSRPFFSAREIASEQDSIEEAIKKLPQILTTFPAPGSSPKTNIPLELASKTAIASLTASFLPPTTKLANFAATPSALANMGAPTYEAPSFS